MERAILVTIDPNPFTLDELENLANALDIECVYKIRQNLKQPNVAFYIGSGKTQEIKQAVAATDANLVIFDDELKPSQIRNLEKALETTIIDRSFLILEIFSRRAKTRQAMLEIDLAQLKYMLPRLTGMSESLSRQGGGNYAKGSGEKKIELDRRRIEKQITKIEDELATINNSLTTQRKKRRQDAIKIVALVGYTNAGKSATMNSLLNLSQNDKHFVFEKDMLFATLDTYVRKIKTNLNQEFLLIDTIGFVSKLPHGLINSFKSTLDEALDADLLIQVVDATNAEYQTHIEITNDVLKSLHADEIKKVYAFSKADLLPEQFFPEYENALLFSNRTKQNIDLLLSTIENTLFSIVEKQMAFPYSQISEIASLEQNAKITKKQYNEDKVLISVLIDQDLLKKYQQYVIE